MVKGSMSPASATRPRNGRGGRIPRDGCRQRARASAPDDRACRQVENRLVVHDDLPPVDRIAQVLHELESLPSVLVMLRRVDLPRRRARVWRRTSPHPLFAGRSRALSRGRVRARCRCWRQPEDSCPRAETAAATSSRTRSASVGRCGRIDERGEHQAELVTTEPRDRPRGSHRRGETRAELAQDVIPDVMSEAVVDLLEAIKVDHEHGEALWRWAWLEGRGKALEEEPAVRQPGEFVGACLAPAFRERAQLPKRVRGSTRSRRRAWRSQERRPAGGPDARCRRIHDDAERAHEKQHRNEVRRLNHPGCLWRDRPCPATRRVAIRNAAIGHRLSSGVPVTKVPDVTRRR